MKAINTINTSIKLCCTILCCTILLHSHMNAEDVPAFWKNMDKKGFFVPQAMTLGEHCRLVNQKTGTIFNLHEHVVNNMKTIPLLTNRRPMDVNGDYSGTTNLRIFKWMLASTDYAMHLDDKILSIGPKSEIESRKTWGKVDWSMVSAHNVGAKFLGTYHRYPAISSVREMINFIQSKNKTQIKIIASKNFLKNSWDNTCTKGNQILLYSILERIAGDKGLSVIIRKNTMLIDVIGPQKNKTDENIDDFTPLRQALTALYKQWPKAVLVDYTGSAQIDGDAGKGVVKSHGYIVLPTEGECVRIDDSITNNDGQFGFYDLASMRSIAHTLVGINDLLSLDFIDSLEMRAKKKNIYSIQYEKNTIHVTLTAKGTLKTIEIAYLGYKSNIITTLKLKYKKDHYEIKNIISTQKGDDYQIQELIKVKKYDNIGSYWLPTRVAGTKKETTARGVVSQRIELKLDNYRVDDQAKDPIE